MQTITPLPLLPATLVLVLSAGCGDAPASEAGSERPVDQAGSPAPEAQGADSADEAIGLAAAAVDPLQKAPPELTEPPAGTPTTYAELCAAQRQACLDGADAMTRLAADRGDAEARADLVDSFRRTAELEPLTLSLAPSTSEAATLAAEQEAIAQAREALADARRQLEAAPQGALLLQELQIAAREAAREDP